MVTAEKDHNSGFISVLLNFSKSSKWCHKINFAVYVHIHMAKKPYFISGCNIAGGKETRTYGVTVRTGELMYECSMEGCNNSTGNLASDDMLVIQRHTQTVRAIDGRSGTERLVFLLFVTVNVKYCCAKNWLRNIIEGIFGFWYGVEDV